MSSRGNFLGTGPASGVYTPKPTPQQAEDMPIYINDELLDLGGRLNNVLEGGAFPPQSQLPKRVKDGMMIYFTQPIKNSEITSAGIWLYKKGRWWKIIDDPSAISQNLTVYKKFPKGSPRPSKPPADKYLEADLDGWSYIPPESDIINDRWMSVANWAVTNPDDPKVEWSNPIMFNTDGASGQPGEDGYSIGFRYIASTIKPTIKDYLAIDPVTLDDEPWLKDIPGVIHPDKSYIWSTYAYIRDNGLRDRWSEPVKYSTPESTNTTDAYGIGKETFPPFDQNAPGLPGPSWTHAIPSPIPSGQNLWRTSRIEWTDGTAQTKWSVPYKANGDVGLTQEVRFIASTDKPILRSNKDRDPVTIDNKPFIKEIPNVTHPSASYVWITNATINGVGEVEIPWSSPSKYATPDATISVEVYGLGTDKIYPTFNPNAAALPGPGWSKTNLNPSPTQRVWISNRFEWSDGTAQTLWTTPTLFSGSVGNNGLTIVNVYKVSASKPPAISDTDRDYPPVGWSKTSATPGPGMQLWSSSSYVTALSDTSVLYPYSSPVQFSGSSGSSGMDGEPGPGFYTFDLPDFQNWPAQDHVDREFLIRFGKAPTTNDVLTIYKTSDPKISKTRRRMSTGAWNEAAVYIHGDMIVRGTIVADNLSANSVDASKIVAGTITGDKITANVALSAPSINGGQITIGSNFSVNNTGYMVCKGASISGTLTGVNGEFSGTLRGVNGTFKGTVQAGTISGSNIQGGNININDNFIVDSNGNLIANNGTFGGTVRAEKIIGNISTAALYSGTNQRAFATLQRNPAYDQTFMMFFSWPDNNAYYIQHSGSTPPIQSVTYTIDFHNQRKTGAGLYTYKDTVAPGVYDYYYGGPGTIILMVTVPKGSGWLSYEFGYSGSGPSGYPQGVNSKPNITFQLLKQGGEISFS